MLPRTALWGLIGLLGLVGQTAAAPQADPPLAERRPGAWLVLSSVVWDVLLDRFTIPLGTAEVSDRDDGCGA